MNGKITRLCQRITWRGGKGQIPKHEAMSTPELGTHERPPSPPEVGAPVCARELCVRLSCGGAGWVSTVSVLSLCRAAARVGGAGLAGLAHTPYDTQHTKYRKINTSAGRPPPLIPFHRGSKSSRLCGDGFGRPVARMLIAQCTHWLGDIRSYDPAARESCCNAARRLTCVCRASRAPCSARALRCTLRPTLPAPPAHARALSLSLSLSRMLCASASARDSVSLGAQFRTHRPGRRLSIGMLAVSWYA